MSVSEETISEYLRGKINPVEKKVDLYGGSSSSSTVSVVHKNFS